MKPTILTLVSLWTLGACSAATLPARTVSTQPKSDDANLSDIGAIYINMVSVFELDQPEFRVLGVRAGLQDYLQGETPAILYQLPERADYVEILRCKSNTILRGTFDDLVDVDLGNPNLNQEAQAFQNNNFWNVAASQTNQCTAVTTGFSGKVFLDADAESGSYRYLVRACVSLEKVSDKEYGLVRNCSRQVALSPVLSDFQNSRAAQQQLAMASLQSFRDRVDGLGREIHYLTVDFNNAYAKCQKDESERQVRVKRKEAVLKITGIGVALGLEIALPEEAMSAVQAGQKTWKQLWSETWEKRDGIAGTGTQVGSVLSWLFSSARDLPRTCTAAKELAVKAEAKTAELKGVHQELAQALDSGHEGEER